MTTRTARARATGPAIAARSANWGPTRRSEPSVAGVDRAAPTERVLVAYQKALAVGAVLVFFTNLPEYLYSKAIVPFHPHLWVAIPVVCVVPVVWHALLSSPMRIRPIAVWCYLYLLLSTLWYFLAVGTSAELHELVRRFLAVIFIMVMLAILAPPAAQHAARKAIAFSVLLAIGLNIYDLFHPLHFSDIIGRSAGLYVNPNKSGAALVIGMTLSRDIVPRRYRLLYDLAIGIAVFITFSRGALVGWLVVFVLGNVRRESSAVNLRSVGVIGLLTAVILVSPWWMDLQASLQDRGVLTTNVRDRIAFISGGGTGDASAESRWTIARQAWDTVAMHPLTGLGTGASYTRPPFDIVEPHNMYLALMVDHGLLGGFILPLLVVASTWGASGPVRGIALAFACFILLWGLVSHNVLGERYILLSFALVAAMAATSARWRRQEDTR